MDSTAKPAPAGADDLLGHGETKPNADYERIVREELARVQERLSQLAPVGMAAAAPPELRVAPDVSVASNSAATNLNANISAFRAAELNGEDRSGRPSSRRGLAGVLVGLLMVGIIVGAGAAWAAYGEAIRPLIATVTPQVTQLWSQVSERFGWSGERSAAATQTATAETASAPQVTASQAATPAAPAAGDIGQMLQSMAHDIASLQQGIDQLKAGQEQMARDNARLADQLKASQEQLARVTARASEASLHPRPPQPAAPKPVVAAVRRPPAPAPVSSLPPPQAIAPPPQASASSAQLQDEEAALPGAPRPPKPVP